MMIDYEDYESKDKDKKSKFCTRCNDYTLSAMGYPNGEVAHVWLPISPKSVAISKKPPKEGNGIVVQPRVCTKCGFVGFFILKPEDV